MRSADATFAVALAATLAACSGSSGPVPPDCTISGCPAGQLCDAGSRTCTAPVACTTSASCPGGQVCDPVTQTCTASTACSTSSCPGGTCWGTVCRRCGVDVACPAPSNTCPAAATAIDLSSGSALVSGSFEGLTYRASWSSGGRGGLLKFTIAGETILSGWMTKTSWLGAPSDSEIAILRDDCTSVVARSTYQGGKEVLPERYLAPGTYYVYVWGDETTERYLASLTAVPAARPQGNTCSSPLPFVWNAGTGAVAIHGDTSGMYECTHDACADTSGSENRQLVYRLDLPSRSYVDLDAGYQVALNIGPDCWGTFACTPWRIEYGLLGKPPLDAGTYYVTASTGTTGMPFDITGTILPWPENESCAAATAIDLSSGTASLWGDTAYTGLDTPIACTSTANVVSKLVYSISTTGLGDQSLDVTVDSPPEPGHGLALQRACESTALADVVACDPYTPGGGTRARISVDVLPPGEYWLAVGDVDGRFDMTVTRGAPRYTPQANDTCGSPTVTTLSSNTTFVLTGDTRGTGDDVSATCGGASTGAGKDVVFRFVTNTRAGRIDFRLVPDAGFDGVLRLDPGCTSAPSPSQPCANASGTGGAETLSVLLDGMQTELWVDGANGTAGTFRLEVKRNFPASNENCASAIPALYVLTPGQPMTGDLTDAFADGAGGCAKAQPDLWYAFTNTGNGPVDVTFTVQPNGFDAVVRVLTDCAQATCPAATDAGATGVAETTPAVTVRGGESVWIEVTSNGPGGPFSIVANAQ